LARNCLTLNILWEDMLRNWANHVHHDWHHDKSRRVSCSSECSAILTVPVTIGRCSIKCDDSWKSFPQGSPIWNEQSKLLCLLYMTLLPTWRNSLPQV
jgi:hypothetical protein